MSSTEPAYAATGDDGTEPAYASTEIAYGATGEDLGSLVEARATLPVAHVRRCDTVRSYASTLGSYAFTLSSYAMSGNDMVSCHASLSPTSGAAIPCAPEP
eukprot:3192664-Rhodomonas_salina.2